MIERKEYARRRRRLLQALEDDCIAIVPTAPARRRNRDVFHAYRPDSDFFYLTGFDEPQAVAVFMPGRVQGEFLLFCEERNAADASLYGPSAGIDAAVSRFGADDAFPSGDLDDILPGLMEERSRVYYTLGGYTEFDHRVFGWMQDLRRRVGYNTAPAEIVALDSIVHDMRLIKSAAELRTIKRAIDASAAGHQRAMSVCRSGMTEQQLEAELLYTFALAGCRYPAYPSIVAGGEHGCVAHYVRNDGELTDGDLVLIDAGAECDYYAADITRTFPVSGSFTPAQAALYDVVLESQLDAIAAVRPGEDVNAPHRAALRTLARGLVDLGLLSGPIEKVLREERYKPFCPHPMGHWLGLDVHDVGDYKLHGTWRALEPGMLMTVEPGLYIGVDAPVPKEFRGQAIRIEDDVLVTRAGPEVLSAAVPKQRAELEVLVGAAHEQAAQ